MIFLRTILSVGCILSLDFLLDKNVSKDFAKAFAICLSELLSYSKASAYMLHLSSQPWASAFLGQSRNRSVICEVNVENVCADFVQIMLAFAFWYAAKGICCNYRAFRHIRGKTWSSNTVTSLGEVWGLEEICFPHSHCVWCQHLLLLASWDYKFTCFQ